MTDADSKVSYFATLRFTKPKEIELIATTRFEDLDLTCVIGYVRKFRILNRLLAEETLAEQKNAFFVVAKTSLFRAQITP